MFVIVHDNSVILGPMRWNKYRFENVILEECEVTAALPNNNANDAIVVADNIKILPIQGTENPEFNPVIEILHGPFWEFTEVAAIQSYQVQSMNPDAVKNQLKALVSAERWRREVAGIKVTVQGIEVTVDTNRGDRDIFIQKFLLMSDTDTVHWKFPEAWITLTKSDLGLIVSSGAQYIQDQFAWESSKIDEIDASTTLAELAVIASTITLPVLVPGSN